MSYSSLFPSEEGALGQPAITPERAMSEVLSTYDDKYGTREVLLAAAAGLANFVVRRGIPRVVFVDTSARRGAVALQTRLWEDFILENLKSFLFST